MATTTPTIFTFREEKDPLVSRFTGAATTDFGLKLYIDRTVLYEISMACPRCSSRIPNRADGTGYCRPCSIHYPRSCICPMAPDWEEVLLDWTTYHLSPLEAILAIHPMGRWS